jgi:5-methylcytosine-specific restriction enzyme B
MTATTTSADPFPRAAALVRERVLVRGTSLCRTRDRLWRPATLDPLHARIRAAADGGGGTLAERWAGALAGAPPPLVQLAAEALTVHLLIASDITASTKGAQIDATLALLDTPPRLPRALLDALDAGRTPTGVAFKRRRLSQVTFLLAAAAAWHRLPAGGRRAGLADPWAFRDWLRTVPVDGAHAQREALLHLAHPATFEPVTSPTAKRRIVAALGSPAEQRLDVDEALLAIRRRLEPRHGRGFSFGAPPLIDRWLT